ncbi:MAG TPA: glycosyltransferase family 9 protein [Pirellulales bacterium]|nr:glycosyltransferase family 9 protein [Pirellulales bacterium]
MAERILIVQLNDLRDILHALPAVAALRRSRPDDHLVWAVDGNYVDLLRGQPWLDRVIGWHRRSPRGLFRFVRELRSERCGIAVDFQGELRSGLAARLSKARRRVGYLPSLEMAHVFYNERRPLESLNLHAVERNLALVEHLGVPPTPPLARPYLDGKPPSEDPASPIFPALRPQERDIAAVNAWCDQRRFDPRREQLVLLNPACNRPSHRWPAARFTQLAKRLLSLGGVRVALVAPAHAATLCEEVARPLGDAIGRADGRFNMLALSELLSRARVVVSADSGLLHLAVASGAVVVGLYGSSDAVRSGPYSASAAVITAKAACSPCYSKNCPLQADPPHCMDELGVDRVFAAVLSRLGQQAGAARRSA